MDMVILALKKYADDGSITVPMVKDMIDESLRAIGVFLDWTQRNNMKCNTSKYKEVCSVKKECKDTFPPIQGIEHLKERTVLGLTIQDNCKFSEHVKTKLCETNKCLYILADRYEKRVIRFGTEVDHLFK